MSVEWFDLGQRLHAARTGSPALRLHHAPIVSSDAPVAVRASVNGDAITVTAATPSTPPATVHGRDALELLGTLGVHIGAVSPATLVTDTPTTLRLLHRLARAADHGTDADDVGAHIAWWRDRADFPGGRAVVNTLAGCAARWVTGTTAAAEGHPATWRTWLDVADDSTAGLLALYTLLTDGTALPHLDTLAEDSMWAWGAAQSEHADGWDWRRPDTPSRAAGGLRARCDASDLYAAALLRDPLYRRRAVDTGHVVTGTAAVAKPKVVQVTSHRLDARLRPGTDVTGRVGGPEAETNIFSGAVQATEVHNGSLVLTVAGVSGAAPATGDTVSLHAAAPVPARQRAGRKNYRSLFASRGSWLTTGRTPTPSRREVPLDVLVAGAEPE